jgi:protein-arginine kinase activator protein McsA
MGSKAHIICAKCGSDEMHFRIEKQTHDDIGTCLICENCAELTGLDEWNEFNGKVDKNPAVNESGEYIYDGA